jgi:hypothetical protein
VRNGAQSKHQNGDRRGTSAVKDQSEVAGIHRSRRAVIDICRRETLPASYQVWMMVTQ